MSSRVSATEPVAGGKLKLVCGSLVVERFVRPSAKITLNWPAVITALVGNAHCRRLVKLFAKYRPFNEI